MQVLSTKGWEEYQLVDSGNGKRLEQFGEYRLVRPDPQAIWKPTLPQAEWEKNNALYDEQKKEWIRKDIEDPWIISYKTLKLQARLTPFKHTGIFPEQQINWDWLEGIITNHKSQMANGQMRILNLFGYTGVASLVCAAAGAQVTHVDASRPAIGWARENQKLSNLEDKPIRWILDDVVKFVAREVRRGVRYEGIIMDPPAYGHGAGGEIWDFHKNFPDLLKLCRQLLSPNPAFVLVNAYAISSSALMLQNVLAGCLSDLGGSITCGELALEEKKSGRLLSTGIFGRWNTIE